MPAYYSNLYGSEYQQPVFDSLNDHNVPCAVCYTSVRSSKLMIPGETTCPSMWTQEYVGYLMAERPDHKRNAVYECVDKDSEAVQVVKLILMVLCSIMLVHSVVLVYLVLPMLLTDQSHVLCAQYEFNIYSND